MLAVIYGLSIGEFAIWAVIICGIIGIAIVAMRAMGVAPPPWAIQIAWIVVIVLVAIFAIRLVMSM